MFCDVKYSIVEFGNGRVMCSNVCAMVWLLNIKEWEVVKKQLSFFIL